MAEFEPDPNGDNIAFVANMVIIDKVNRTSAWLKKQVLKHEFRKDCGCSGCRQRISDIAEDNLDIANWMVEKEGTRWGKALTVRKRGKRIT